MPEWAMHFLSALSAGLLILGVIGLICLAVSYFNWLFIVFACIAGVCFLFSKGDATEFKKRLEGVAFMALAMGVVGGISVVATECPILPFLALALSILTHLSLLAGIKIYYWWRGR